MEKRCPKCSVPLLAGDVFCASCGASINPSPPAARSCAACKAPLLAGDQFCSACGSSGTAKPSAAPGSRPFSPPPSRSNTQVYGKNKPLPIWPFAVGSLALIVVTIFLLGPFHDRGGTPSNRMETSGIPSGSVASSNMPPPATPAYQAVQTVTKYTCHKCDGSGRIHPMVSKRLPCSTCRGTGRSALRNSLGYYVDCETCRGSGVMSMDVPSADYVACDLCGGKGYQTDDDIARLRQQGADPETGFPQWYVNQVKGGGNQSTAPQNYSNDPYSSPSNFQNYTGH
jgi:hypothetical protein